MDIEYRINNDNFQVPENTIAIVTEDIQYEETINEIVEPLVNYRKRDWFTSHFYYCLPLLIGNQYGFVIKSMHDFNVIWYGSEDPSSLKIKILSQDNLDHQYIDSHFGSGIITVQNRFHFRTPPGINLMTINPSNFLLPDMQNLVGVIETDNLRRDFTFNIKVTTSHKLIEIKKGQPIAAFLPIPRYFVDPFQLKTAREIFPLEVIQNELEMGRKFSVERQGVDKQRPHDAGRRYFKGEDADGIKFKDHQTKL